MLIDLTITEFLERVASGEAVPGGGAVAALCAALAADLVTMVARLTVGRQNDPALDAKMKSIIERAESLRADLARSVDADANAYAGVMAAYRLPKSTDHEKRFRNDAIQESLKGAARVPLGVAEMAVTTLTLAVDAVNKGNRNATTDALTGALLARSAVLAAVANVRINIQGIADEEFAKDARTRSESLEKKAVELEKIVRLAAAPQVDGGT